MRLTPANEMDRYHQKHRNSFHSVAPIVRDEPILYVEYQGIQELLKLMEFRKNTFKR